MKRQHPILFRRIDWSTGHVLAQTRDAARAEGLPVVLLDEWSDVDSRTDLEQLVARTDSAARRTRAFALEHLGRV